MKRELKELYLAWTKEGISPNYHKKQMELLKKNWYPLYRAMVMFTSTYGLTNHTSPSIYKHYFAIPEKSIDSSNLKDKKK